MIDIRGKLVAAACGDRLKVVDGIRHLVVVPAEQSATGEDLTISQADLDSLIRSKAAMYTILETLAMTVGVQPRASSAPSTWPAPSAASSTRARPSPSACCRTCRSSATCRSATARCRARPWP
ncbi:MAG: ASKHA domain-containing protein [Desulfobacterales bacterium]|nr:ASKHA domain-containing protein [Desulfobacterales bacterium]